MVKPKDEQTNPFLNDVIDGLSKPKKSLPSRWFYDEEGSKLFDRITQLPEYYLMRTETAILKANAKDITDRLGPEVALVEYGAGSARKVRILFDASERFKLYLPFDISIEHLGRTVERLEKDYPGLAILPIEGDFMERGVKLKLEQDTLRRVGFFSGSTIGNLSNQQISKFMKSARSTLESDGLLLVGVDLPKSLDVLLPAYNDAEGVTAEFNLNILKRANRELNASFDLNTFKHSAIWNDKESRVEMHLVCQQDQEVRVDDRSFNFRQGETIHTENSRKMSVEYLSDIIEDWTVDTFWTDENNYFALILLR